MYQLGLECPYGDRCSFAHGIKELKQKSFVSERYKTIRCTKFHKNSYCHYGPRCQFIHRQGKKNRAKKFKPKYQHVLACLQNCCQPFAENAKREKDLLTLLKETSLELFKLPKLAVFESIRNIINNN